MDNNENGHPSAERSAEEVAWDQEFDTTSSSKSDNVTSTLADLAKLAVQVPTAVAQMMGVMFPQDTRRHARAAAREGFLTVRSLLGAVGDGIESILSEPSDQSAPGRTTVAGPPGTWGSATQASTPATDTGSGRARRIAINDEPALDSGDNDLPENRGLNANIDY